MAIAALEGPQDEIAATTRLPAPVATRCECAAPSSDSRDAAEASLYVWAEGAAGMTSAGFAERLLDEAAVIVTAG